MSGLAVWHCKRLRVLARGPRSYGRFDTVNAVLAKRKLIAPTGHSVRPNRTEYEITDAGRLALRMLEDGSVSGAEAGAPVAPTRSKV